MNNKFKLYICFCIFFSFCSSSQENTVESPLENKIKIVENTTTTSTSTTLTYAEMEENFLAYYFENKIDGYLTLSPEEVEITKNLRSKYPTFFTFDLSCYSKEKERLTMLY